jgi:hypothetical protein
MCEERLAHDGNLDRRREILRADPRASHGVRVARRDVRFAARPHVERDA